MKISKCRTNFIHVAKSNLKFGGLDPSTPMLNRPNQGLEHVLGFMRSRPMVVVDGGSSFRIGRIAVVGVFKLAGEDDECSIDVGVLFIRVEGDLVLSPSFPCSLLSFIPHFLIGQCPFLAQPLPYTWHLTISGEIHIMVK
ncbi:hypothetical protein D8674_017028 [Pyrus ussuriensis x Pyrus communis]|uniref:Uncharacterized protein n=1 Tax=Pyrus ussuriensis x Pyrus communis TaxID=2448454 RepID=A0A5N5HCL1_9ROSA|nr:hypothetical protein D8674_017028 [Pyrus ussuriensis x Pyrus communis]